MREAGSRWTTLSLSGCSLLTLVTLSFTALVEYRNWKADHYLPCAESEGKWRVLAGDQDPRAILRGTVISFGLPLYLLCPVTILWAAFASARSFGGHPIALPVSMTCLAVGILSSILMTSLHLLDSLG